MRGYGATAHGANLLINELVDALIIVFRTNKSSVKNAAFRPERLKRSMRAKRMWHNKSLSQWVRRRKL
jgi:hypothetical protein